MFEKWIADSDSLLRNSSTSIERHDIETAKLNRVLKLPLLLWMGVLFIIYQNVFDWYTNARINLINCAQIELLEALSNDELIVFGQFAGWNEAPKNWSNC